MANSDLTKHAETLPEDDLAKLHAQAGDVLRKRGAAVTMIDAFDLKTLPDSGKGAPAFAKKDFSILNAVGFTRSYSAYFATSEPKAHVGGLVYIVNLNDNSLEWYKDISVVRAADGKWLAQSIEIALADTPGSVGTEPFRTVRYPEGGIERMERAQVIRAHCGLLVLRTLRGNLMAVPFGRSSPNRAAANQTALNPIPHRPRSSARAAVLPAQSPGA